jgi:hypothetical protein
MWHSRLSLFRASQFLRWPYDRFAQNHSPEDWPDRHVKLTVSGNMRMVEPRMGFPDASIRIYSPKNTHCRSTTPNEAHGVWLRQSSRVSPHAHTRCRELTGLSLGVAAWPASRDVSSPLMDRSASPHC